MFERYTEKARRVIFFGRYEASQFGSTAIEPEHILLGILREDRVLTRRLLSETITIESIRREIESRTLLRDKLSTTVEIPLAPESKRVLAYAHEESDRMQHRHIGTDHLLLGILREDRSLAAQILYERGFRLNAVRELVRLNYQRKVAEPIEVVLKEQSLELDLSGAGLTELPEEVAKLTWLRRLKLSDNRLTVLPEFVGHLTQLECLDLSSNQLTSLPDSLLSLRGLVSLYLHDNDALGLPAEILGPAPSSDTPDWDPAKILEYYYRVRGAGEGQALNEAKLILVGRGAVGKTSIVNRLVYDCL